MLYRIIISSGIFLLAFISAIGQNKINAYEYWFNNSNDERTSVNVPVPSQDLVITTDIAATSLPGGLHTLYIRFKDDSSHYSVPLAAAFQKLRNIAAYEYWFDYDYSKANKVSISAVNDLNLNVVLPLVSITSGMHILNIRFLDEAGNWSVVHNSFFIRKGNISKYQYWFNDAYTQIKTVSIGSQESAIINAALPAGILNNGMNLLTIRYGDDFGNWSVPENFWFVKKSNGSTLLDAITAYRYWTDVSEDGVKEELFSKPVSPQNLETYLNVSDNVLKVYFQFKDTSGLWTAVYEKIMKPEASFYPYPGIESRQFVFENRSLVAASYAWDFGDGKKSTEKLPTHQYTLPGLYHIQLIASNANGKDTAYASVELRGIQKTFPDKAGNRGFVTIKAYAGGLKPTSVLKLKRQSFDDIIGDSMRFPQPGVISTIFKLVDEEIGYWSAVIETAGESEMRLDSAITFEQGTGPKVWVELAGRDRFLLNRYTTYTINYGNSGNTDARSIPLWIAVNDRPDVEVLFHETTFQYPDSSLASILDTTPLYIIREDFKGLGRYRLYGIYLPYIGASSSNSINIKIKAGSDINVRAWVNDSYLDMDEFGYNPFKSTMMDAKTELNACIAYVAGKAFANGMIGLIPGAGCLSNAADAIWTTGEEVYSVSQGGSWGSSLYNLGWNWGSNLLKCAYDEFPVTKVLGLAYDIWDAKSANDECYKKFKERLEKEKNPKGVTSFDPNEMVGPKGYTSKRYISSRGSLLYKIYFENKSTASAPAQEVFVYDTLDRNVYDLKSFELEAFSYGDTTIVLPKGLNEFSLDIDSKATKGYILRLYARLDTITGVAYWRFLTLDPTTMDLSEDPDMGFLPPNVTSPEGEGFVSFYIRAKENIQTGTELKNKATIIFDVNAPIVTNEFVNTIDDTNPQGTITELAQITDSTVRVHWTGLDDHSGAKLYSIYVSENGNPFKLWLDEVNVADSLFKGQMGNTYAFKMLVVDSSDNRKSLPDNAEMQLKLIDVHDQTFRGKQNTITASPVPATDVLNVQYTTLSKGQVLIYATDFAGKQFVLENIASAEPGTYQKSFDISSLSPGFYVCTYRTDTFTDNFKIIVK